MKQYREYMDGVRVSDTLHRRLAELEAPARRPVPWVKYGSLAAALALVVGLGTWWLSREEAYDHLVDYDPAAPENEVVAVPDIALVDPGDITEELVSRFVRWAVLEGLDLSGISSDGAAPEAIDPNYSVGEPNWNDSGEGWTCPDCGMHIEAGAEHHHSADGGVDTSYYDPNGYALNAYDPNELADRGIDPGQAVPESDSSLTCRTCGGGVPDGTGHYCKPDGSGGYVCALCGQAFPEGKVHSHEMCELPVAPDTVTCPDCGMTYLAGEAHECGMCDGYPLPHVCEVCGEAYPEGTAHTCSQGGHHQEQHHGGHH